MLDISIANPIGTSKSLVNVSIQYPKMTNASFVRPSVLKYTKDSKKLSPLLLVTDSSLFSEFLILKVYCLLSSSNLISFLVTKLSPPPLYYWFTK